MITKPIRQIINPLEQEELIPFKEFLNQLKMYIPPPLPPPLKDRGNKI